MNSNQNALTEDLKVALKHAEQLLSQNPLLAEQQANEILKVYPAMEVAQRILAAAFRLQGKPARSLELLEPLASRNSGSPSFLFEYGQTLGAVGRGNDAIKCIIFPFVDDTSVCTKFRF